MLQKLLLNIVYLCFAVFLNLISVGYKLKTTFVIAAPGETSKHLLNEFKWLNLCNESATIAFHISYLILHCCLNEVF